MGHKLAFVILFLALYFIVSVLFAFIFLYEYNLVVSADPPTIHQFYGTITLADGSSPDGSIVEIKFNDIVVASTTSLAGKYGYDPLFIVEDQLDGDLLEFYLDSTKVADTSFSNFGFTQLDLQISGGDDSGDDSGGDDSGGGGGDDSGGYVPPAPNNTNQTVNYTPPAANPEPENKAPANNTPERFTPGKLTGFAIVEGFFASKTTAIAIFITALLVVAIIIGIVRFRHRQLELTRLNEVMAHKGNYYIHGKQ